MAITKLISSPIVSALEHAVDTLISKKAPIFLNKLRGSLRQEGATDVEIDLSRILEVNVNDLPKSQKEILLKDMPKSTLWRGRQNRRMELADQQKKAQFLNQSYKNMTLESYMQKFYPESTKQGQPIVPPEVLKRQLDVRADSQQFKSIEQKLAGLSPAKMDIGEFAGKRAMPYHNLEDIINIEDTKDFYSLTNLETERLKYMLENRDFIEERLTDIYDNYHLYNPRKWVDDNVSLRHWKNRWEDLIEKVKND